MGMDDVCGRTELVLGEADGLGIHDLVRLLVLQDTVLQRPRHEARNTAQS